MISKRNWYAVSSFDGACGNKDLAVMRVGHVVSNVVWDRVNGRGSRAGRAVCDCGAEMRVLEYAKSARGRK